MYWRSIHGSSGLHQSDVIASLVRAFKFIHCIFLAAQYSNKLILLKYKYWWMKEIYMDPTGFEPAHLETFKLFVNQRSYTFVLNHQLSTNFPAAVIRTGNQSKMYLRIDLQYKDYSADCLCWILFKEIIFIPYWNKLDLSNSINIHIQHRIKSTAKSAQSSNLVSRTSGPNYWFNPDHQDYSRSSFSFLANIRI